MQGLRGSAAEGSRRSSSIAPRSASYEKADRYGGAVMSQGVEQRIAAADRIAQVVNLDMVGAG
jgi:hypothetical protein